MARSTGVEMNQLLGMIAATAEVTQNSASVVGNSMKTIFSRMSNIAAGKELDAEGEKLNDVEESLNRVGIKLRENETDWRNFYSVLDEIASKWEGFTDTEKSQITTALGGTRQRENVLTMLENWDKVKEYADIGANANGTAMEKYGIVLESVSAKQDQLTAKVQEFYGNILNSSFIAALLDIVKVFMDIMNVGDGLIGKVVLLIALFAALQAVMKTNIFKGLASIFASIGKNIVNIITAIPVWIRGIKSTTAAQKALTVAQEESNAAAAANPYVAIAELIIMAIMGIITAIKAHNRAIEESIEKAKELKEAYEGASKTYKENIESLTETTSEKHSGEQYKDLQEEFDVLTKGVDAYGRNLSLSNEEYNRYKTICEQIIELNPDLLRGYSSETEAIGNKNSALQDTIDLLKLQARLEAQKYANSSGEVLEGVKNNYETQTKSSAYADASRKLSVIGGLYKVAIEDAMDVLDDVLSDSLLDEIEKFKDSDLEVLANAAFNNVNGYGLGGGNGIASIIFNSDEFKKATKEQQQEILTAYQRSGLLNITDLLSGLEGSYKEANEYFKSIQDELANSMLSVYEAVLKSDERYENFDSSTKSFFAKWISNSDIFKIDENTTSEEVDKAKKQIQDMINLVANSTYVAHFDDGTTAIGQAVFAKLFEIDDNAKNLTVAEYRQQIEDVLRNIVAMVNSIKPEDVTEEQIVEMGAIFGFKMIADDKKGIHWDESELEDVLNLLKSDVREYVQKKINNGEYTQEDVEVIIGLKAGIENGSVNIDSTSNLDAWIANAKINAQEATDVFSDYANELQTLSEKYEILSKAQDEYNQYGNITASTMQKLIKNDLLDYLEQENGHLVFNTEKLQENADKLKNNAIANLQASLYTDLNRIALGTYQEAADDVNGDGVVNEIDKQIKAFQKVIGSATSATAAVSAYAEVSGADTSGWSEKQKKQADAVFNNYKNMVAKVKALTSNLASGIYRSKGSSSSSSTNKVLSNMKKQVESLESPIKVLDNQIKELGNIDTIDEYNKQLDLVNKKSVLISNNITKIQNLIKKTKDKETLQYLKEKLSSYKADLANIKDTIDNIRLNKLKLQLEDLEKPIKDVDDAIKRIGNINTVEEKEKEASLLAEKFRLISSNIKTINELLKDTTLSKDMRELLEKELQDLLVDSVGIRDDIESNIRESVELEKKNAQLQAELDYKQKLYDIETMLYGNDGKDAWEHLQEERIAAIQKEIDARNEEKEAQEKITEEQELQNKLLEAKISLQNALNNKTVKILTKQDDGTWQYEYSANMADVKSATDNLKNAQKEYDDWKKEQDTQKLQDEIDALNKEKEEKSNTYSDNEFHLKQSLEAQTNSIEEYYDDIDKITQKRMADYQKIYGDEWDKVIGIAQQKVAKLSALNTELTAKSQYAFETVGTDNTYVKKIQSFGIGGTIRGSGLAFVHDKERVLTSQQNSLFEKVVSKLPNLLKISDMFRRTDVVNSRISGVNNNNNTSSDKITINKVECVFPNATNSTEIQKAILGLPRLAIQK